MSLAIDIDRVTAVLLADGWHIVDTMNQSGQIVSSFSTDAYEFVEHTSNEDEGRVMRVAGGDGKIVGYTGVYFASQGENYYCPLSAVLSVRTTAAKKMKATPLTSRQKVAE
jgi:hypothetical protein